LAGGALAIVDGDDRVAETPVELRVPAAARFAADGEVAGCSPGTSTGGAGCWDGSCGSAERATAEESVDAVSDFHQAHLGPDWHPIVVARSVATVNIWAVVVFMSAMPTDVRRRVPVESRVLVRVLHVAKLSDARHHAMAQPY
jgi:hypothetical protein